MKNFPQQRLSFNEKSKNDYQWAKDTMDALLSNHQVDPRGTSFVNTEYNRKLSNYQLYNNMLNQADFQKECNPFGLEVGQFQDTIQPYNKTYNKIQVLLGEELARPFPYKAVLVNSEGVKSKLAHRDYLLKQYVYSQIESTLSQVSEVYPKDLTEKYGDAVMNPQEIDSYMRTSYMDGREILSNKILSYLSKKLRIKKVKNDAFKHALIAGEEVVYVAEQNGNVVVDAVNPLTFFHHRSPEQPFIHYSLYAGTKTYMTTGEVLDNFGETLTDEQAKQIDSTYQGSFGIQSDIVGSAMKYNHDQYENYSNNMSYPYEGSYSQSRGDDHLVQHVEWRSQRRVGFLSYTNEFGDNTTSIVSEDFEIPTPHQKVIKTEEYGKKNTYYIWQDLQGNSFSLQWKWIPEIWSGVKIGSDIYTMIGPKQEQFRLSTDPYDVRLGYHGVTYSAMNAPAVSLMDRMKPFQYLYFLIMHKVKRFIAQDQGKVFHFDTTMIDPKVGLEKTLYYLKEMNIDFYNPLMNAEQAGWAQRAKVHGSTDWSNMQNILAYVQLLDAIDAQISDVAGINKQREGQISPTEAVTNAQSNRTMSSMITEIYYDTHQVLWEEVLNSVLKVGIKVFKGQEIFRQYVLDDLSVATLNLTSDSLDNTEVGVFVSNTSKDIKIFDTLQQAAEALIRANKATMSDMIKMLKAESVEELQREIESSERAAEARAQQQQERELQVQQQIHQEVVSAQKYKTDEDNATKIRVAEIGSFSRQMDQDTNDNDVPDQLEIEKLKIDTAFKAKKLQNEERALDIKEKALKNKPKTA